MNFELATLLDTLLIGRNPQWRPQTEYKGAPERDTDGEDLRSAVTTHLRVQLRENLRFRTGRFTVSDIQNSTAYEAVIRTSTASFTSDSDATEVEIVEGLVQEINALRLDVRARSIDQDGDGNVDEVRVESNHSCVTVASVNSSDTYFIVLNGERIEYDSDASATEAEIISGLETALDQATAVSVDAYSEDTTGSGDVDTLFFRPFQAGSLIVDDIGATGSGDLTLEAQGYESDNPNYEVASGSTGRLDLDADAIELDLRWFSYPVQGDISDNQPPGWDLEDEWNQIDYRGFSESVITASKQRGYLEVDNRKQGTPRNVSIGPAVQEGEGS